MLLGLCGCPFLGCSRKTCFFRTPSSITYSKHTKTAKNFQKHTPLSSFHLHLPLRLISTSIITSINNHPLSCLGQLFSLPTRQNTKKEVEEGKGEEKRRGRCGWLCYFDQSVYPKYPCWYSTTWVLAWDTSLTCCIFFRHFDFIVLITFVCQ